MKDQFKAELTAFKHAMETFPWQSNEAYGDWLSQTYYFVSETTTLLTLAAAKSEKNSKLQLRFIEHAAEEKGHDKLLVMDLKGLGESLTSHPELPATSSMYQPQYFWLHQRDTRAFFGYIILLEGMAAQHGPIMNELAAKAHGKAATHFLRVHSSEDIDHIEKALNEVSLFPPDVQVMVMQNFLAAAGCYKWMLSSIAERTASGAKVAA